MTKIEGYSTRETIVKTIAALESYTRLEEAGFASEIDTVNELEIAKRTLHEYEKFDGFVRANASLFKIGIVGDLYRFREGVEFDLQFPGVVEAASFARTFLNDVAIEDARFVNPVRDLTSPVTITVRFESSSPLTADVASVLRIAATS